jgi:hypothetical protein
VTSIVAALALAGAISCQSDANGGDADGAGGAGPDGAVGTAGTAPGSGGTSAASGGGSATGGASATGGSTSGTGGSTATTDGGADEDAAVSPDGAPPVPDAATDGTPTIVAVGYAGLRVASYDLGRSWVNKVTLSNVAADDKDNLRGVAFARGLFVAVGHKLFTSTDGETWARGEHPNDDSQWLAGIQFGNGRFVSTGGYGYTVWSPDGFEWNQGDFLEAEASRSLAFGNGTFVTQTDPGNWWRSTDGDTWTRDSSGHSEHVAYCDGSFQEEPDCGLTGGHGVYVRGGGWSSGVIQWGGVGVRHSPTTTAAGR